MIDKIFWDIDETLIHTVINTFFEVEGTATDVYEYYLLDSMAVYRTFVRKYAKNVIDFSRELIGFNNVYILTTSTSEYANNINKLAGWNFPENQIFTRETIASHKVNTGYNDYCMPTLCNIASRNNVLIDNLSPRYNEAKMTLIGIKQDRYLNVRDYYGVEFPSDAFEEQIKKFLTEKNNEVATEETVAS